MKSFLHIAAGALLCATTGAVAATAFDCAALQPSGNPLPRGYSGQCAGSIPAPATGDDVRVPTDIGLTLDILGNGVRPIGQLYSFQLNNFPVQTLRSPISTTLLGIDFSPDGSTLYGVSAQFDPTLPRWLGTIPQPNGNFTPIAALTGLPPNETINGFALDPRSGVAYLSGSSGAPMAARLYTVNLETAAATLIGTMSTPNDPAGNIMVALAINCEGALYAHNLTDDSLYLIDRSNAAATRIGTHGLDANFAQGMDFDNSDGQLYAFMMLASGENRFGRLDTTTGAFTTLANNDPAGEYEGAIPGVCPALPVLFADGFEDPAGTGVAR